MALDEHRKAFSPTLWYLPKVDDGAEHADPVKEKKNKEDLVREQEKLVEEASAAWYASAYDKKLKREKRDELKLAYNEARRVLMRRIEDCKDPSELLQVWFPGVHINIGGGSSDTLEEKGDLEEMANITFAWMLEQIRPYLSINETTIYQEDRARQNHIDELNEEVRKYIEKEAADKAEADKSWTKWVSRSVASAAKTVTRAKQPNTLRRDFGWGTGTIIDSYTLMYHLNGSGARTPGAYAKDSTHAAPGDTRERIHPTVGYRYEALRAQDEKIRYHPAGLSDKQYRRERVPGGGKGWQYVLGEGVVLPEYVIEPSSGNGPPSFERLAMCLGWEKVTPYMNKLDKENGFSVSE